MLPLVATLVSATEKTSALGALIYLLCGRPGFDPWVGKITWRRGQLPTPVFWPGEFHGLYSPWGRKESDTTEWLSLSLGHLFSPGLEECKEKNTSLNKCPQAGPGKRIQKRADDKRAISTGQFYTVLLLFFLNHMKSLHTLKSYRNANQNYNEESPHTGQNDLCQKVHKQ